MKCLYIDIFHASINSIHWPLLKVPTSMFHCRSITDLKHMVEQIYLKARIESFLKQKLFWWKDDASWLSLRNNMLHLKGGWVEAGFWHWLCVCVFKGGTLHHWRVCWGHKSSVVRWSCDACSESSDHVILPHRMLSRTYKRCLTL